ncbi:MAG: hypothetical protein D6737_18570, partial [Chloroflexi bacterium]
MLLGLWIGLSILTGLAIAATLTIGRAIHSDGVLAFVSNRDGNPEIYLIDLDDGREHRLTRHIAADNSPAWSPDGKSLAFVSTRDGNPEIYVMHIGDNRVERLTNNLFLDLAPVWSPDGSAIAFESTRNGNPEIYIRNLADGTLINLTQRMST